MIHRVHLVGAGPGDPELLTVRAARLLGEADVVVHDALVGDGVLPSCEEQAHHQQSQLVPLAGWTGGQDRRPRAAGSSVLEQARHARAQDRGREVLLRHRGGAELPESSDLVQRGLYQAETRVLDRKPAERIGEHRVGAAGGQIQQRPEQLLPPARER